MASRLSEGRWIEEAAVRKNKAGREIMTFRQPILVKRKVDRHRYCHHLKINKRRIIYDVVPQRGIRLVDPPPLPPPSTHRRRTGSSEQGTLRLLRSNDRP